MRNRGSSAHADSEPKPDTKERSSCHKNERFGTRTSPSLTTSPHAAPDWKGSLGELATRPQGGQSPRVAQKRPGHLRRLAGGHRAVKRWIHLDNYIFQDDEIGNRFADALSAKAKEGVRVRVLHDWFGCLDVPRSFWNGMRETGVEVEAVNPPPLVRR